MKLKGQSAGKNNRHFNPDSDELLDFIAAPDITEEAERSREKIFDAIQSRIDAQRHGQPAPVKIPRRTNIWKYAAACIIAAACASIAFYQLGYLTGVNRLTATLIELESPVDGTLRVTLPDNSVVTLNSGSRISYPSFFGKKDRTVCMEGEGYFDVAKDRKPFLVETAAGFSVEVLGTRFNLKSFSRDDYVWLTLEEGSVAASIPGGDDTQQIIITPNQQVILDKTSGDVRVEEVHPGLFTYWVSGGMFFENDTLEEIAMVLENRFDVEIIFRNERLKNLTYYSQFGKDDGLERILILLSNKDGWKYRIEEDRVIIY